MRQWTGDEEKKPLDRETRSLETVKKGELGRSAARSGSRVTRTLVPLSPIALDHPYAVRPAIPPDLSQSKRRPVSRGSSVGARTMGAVFEAPGHDDAPPHPVLIAPPSC